METRRRFVYLTRGSITYLVDKGSYVDDYMGYVDGDYYFDFVNRQDALTMKVGNKALKAESISENKYGFGKNGDGAYQYVLEYIPGDKKAGEHFRWTTNVPVSNFAQVQIMYQVKLTNPKTKAGTYGKYDRDGSNKYDGLYTNNEATLTPVTTSGKTLEAEKFAKPTVSYTASALKPVTAGDLPIQKIVKGDKLKKYPTFSFKIAPVSTTAGGLKKTTMPMPGKVSASVTGPGTTEFGGITFQKAGTYVYKITESADGQKGWTYDTSEYVVTYVVKETAVGKKLTVHRTVRKDGASRTSVVFTNTYKKPLIPKTGDNSELPLALTVLGASALLLALVSVYRRKAKNNE